MRTLNEKTKTRAFPRSQGKVLYLSIKAHKVPSPWTPASPAVKRRDPRRDPWTPEPRAMPSYMMMMM
jgi:hypothetical protein